MSVKNVKVQHIRPQYNNLKDWIANPKNEYIGRGGIVFIDGERYPKQDSIWCNPYKIGKDGDRDEVLKKYEKHLRDMLKNSEMIKKLKALKGKNLGCWCAPEKCHGDTLLEIINNL